MILEELVMKKSYGVNELRRMYLDFFESKGHLVTSLNNGRGR